MISDVTQLKLNSARLTENTYQPSGKIADKLQTKTLIMLVGPAAIGKSSIVNLAPSVNSKFAKVVDVVTRPRRDTDEPGLYEYVEHSDEGLTKIFEKIKNQEFVQYAVHPTTGYFYGTRLQDFPAQYNVLATLSNVVEGLRKLPFRETFTVGVVADSQAWRERLTQRFPEKSEERTKRLNEAIQSLEWQLAQNENDIFWLENSQNQLEQAATDLVEIVLTKKRFNKRGLALQMLQTAKELL